MDSKITSTQNSYQLLMQNHLQANSCKKASNDLAKSVTILNNPANPTTEVIKSSTKKETDIKTEQRDKSNKKLLIGATVLVLTGINLAIFHKQIKAKFNELIENFGFIQKNEKSNIPQIINNYADNSDKAVGEAKEIIEENSLLNEVDNNLGHSKEVIEQNTKEILTPQVQSFINNWKKGEESIKKYIESLKDNEKTYQRNMPHHKNLSETDFNNLFDEKIWPDKKITKINTLKTSIKNNLTDCQKNGNTSGSFGIVGFTSPLIEDYLAFAQKIANEQGFEIINIRKSTIDAVVYDLKPLNLSQEELLKAIQTAKNT
ncbi:MAG: hypothetical protein WCK67_03305 [bacterium]